MMMPRAGLLPFYLELYDEVRPETRAEFGPFLDEIAAGLEADGLSIGRAPVCRNRSEFERAVADFESSSCDAIVTVHLAYSPSEESIDALCGTSIPIVILDTTMDPAFDRSVSLKRLMYNHGIHGVMDLTSMLRRRGRAFSVVAGHASESDVVARACARVRAAAAARSWRGSLAVRVGARFAGMGDFHVEADAMARALEVTAREIAVDEVRARKAEVPAAEVDAEMASDRERFEVVAPEEVHRRSVAMGLALRAVLDDAGAGAFSCNFLECDAEEDAVPFLEAGKAMARGVGYAGEGDVLTASLVGALGRGFGATTFTEIFCPDWRGGSLFLSHMGEVNPACVVGRARLIEKAFPYTPAGNPASLAGCIRPGRAAYVDLAPGPGEGFRLIVSDVEMLDDSDRDDAKGAVRGWMKPGGDVATFLEEYARAGGTHHAALVLDRSAADLAAFAVFAGVECVTI